MRKILLALCLFMLVSSYVDAQDNLTPYDIALQRMQEAAETGATELYLTHLWLTELPSEIGQLTNLQVLLLSNNRLTSLPPEIGRLINLRYLSLDTNQLSSLPSEIGHLTSLYSLTLVHNQLTSLPSEIGQLTSLQVLYLNDNQLTDLPSEIGQLISLKRLHLGNNELRHLPSEMGNLRSTFFDWSINLDNNPLISPPPQVVEQGTVAVSPQSGVVSHPASHRCECVGCRSTDNAAVGCTA